MFLVYQPEGQPEQRWHYQPGRFKVPEMRLIEKTTGMRWKQFQGELEMGSVVALQALLWTFQRRQHPTLKVEDVDFFADELDLVKDVDELNADLESLEDAAGSMPEADRQAGIAYTRMQLRTAPQSPGKASAATPAEFQQEMHDRLDYLRATADQLQPAPAAASTPPAEPAPSTS